jgi:hypothetical protein
MSGGAWPRRFCARLDYYSSVFHFSFFITVSEKLDEVVASLKQPVSPVDQRLAVLHRR